MKKLLKIIIPLMVLIILTAGCEQYKKLAVGRDEPVFTLVDDSLWSVIEDDIRPVIEKEIRTPQVERIFYFSPIDLKSLKDYRFSKNILLITTLDATDKTSEYIKRSLPDKAVDMIRSGECYFFPEKEKLARRQIFMVLAAPDTVSLLKYIRSEENSLFNTLNRAFIERQTDQIYYKAEEKSLTKEIFKRYGFAFRVPHSYKILEADSREKIVQLGRANPYRWITIHWQEGGFKSVLDDKWAVKMRYWLGQNYLDGTYIENKFITKRLVSWGDRPVFNIRGLWGHPEKAMGGPFSSFYFYDGATNRTYFIDVTVWAPGQTKNVYLRQMELIVSSFFTQKEVLEEMLK